MKRFSLSEEISLKPNFLRRVSTSWFEIPCLMSASSQSSGTAISSPEPPAVLPFFQNCHDFLGLPPAAPSSASSAAFSLGSRGGPLAGGGAVVGGGAVLEVLVAEGHTRGVGFRHVADAALADRGRWVKEWGSVDWVSTCAEKRAIVFSVAESAVLAACAEESPKRRSLQQAPPQSQADRSAPTCATGPPDTQTSLKCFQYRWPLPQVLRRQDASLIIAAVAYRILCIFRDIMMPLPLPNLASSLSLHSPVYRTAIKSLAHIAYLHISDPQEVMTAPPGSPYAGPQLFTWSQLCIPGCSRSPASALLPPAFAWSDKTGPPTYSDASTSLKHISQRTASNSEHFKLSSLPSHATDASHVLGAEGLAESALFAKFTTFYPRSSFFVGRCQTPATVLPIRPRLLFPSIVCSPSMPGQSLFRHCIVVLLAADILRSLFTWHLRIINVHHSLIPIRDGLMTFCPWTLLLEIWVDRWMLPRGFQVESLIKQFVYREEDRPKSESHRNGLNML
ncbi:hypothetical protein KCU83_g558, partial [Aureobasidium melanogenum]